MRIDDIPLWLLFLGTILLVVGTIELGYLLGKASRRRPEEEKESPVSAITSTVLAFWLSSWRSPSASSPIGMTTDGNWYGIRRMPSERPT